MLNEIKALWDGLWTVFKHLFKKPVTLEYPEKRRELNDEFRGKLEVKGCIGCKICQKVCPTGAISIDKTLEKTVYKIDMKKCIFCGNCVYYCPKSAVRMTKEYELATDKKEDLILVFEEVNNAE